MTTQYLYPRFLLVLTGFIFLFSHCIAPYETARMLSKDELEIKAGYTNVNARSQGESLNISNGIGAGLGIGYSKRLNFKLRIEYLFSDISALQFVSAGIKLGLIKDRLAFGLPIWAFLGEGASSYGISPMLLLALTPPSAKKFEVNLGLRSDFSFDEDLDNTFGLNLGFGLSKDLNKWAVRPDLGLYIGSGSGAFEYSLGLGFSRVIAPKGERKK